MIKICFFIHNIAGHGGTEKICTALANELALLPDYNVSILSLENFDIPFFSVNPQIEISSLKFSNSDIRKDYFKVISKYRKYLKANAIDIVVDVDIILSAISIPATTGIKTKVISWEHYNFFSKNNSFIRKISRKLAPKYSYCVVTLTEEDVLNYQNNVKCRRPIVCIPNFLSSMPDKTANLESKIVLSIGHLVHGKGFDLLLEIWNSISSSVRNGWELHIVGSGEEEDNILKYIEKHELSDSVKILPPTPTIQENYSQASVFAFTSRAEGFPLVLIEALSFGLPTISFNCSTGPSEIIQNNIDGFLIQTFEIKPFAEKLSLLISDEQLRKEMGKNAIMGVERFSKEKIVEKWQEALDGTG